MRVDLTPKVEGKPHIRVPFGDSPGKARGQSVTMIRACGINSDTPVPQNFGNECGFRIKSDFPVGPVQNLRNYSPD